MEKKDIFPIAIWSFGLGASRIESWSDDNIELVIDENEMNALIYSFKKGQNYEISNTFFNFSMFSSSNNL